MVVIPLIAQKEGTGQDILLEGLLRNLKEDSKHSDLVSDELILQGDYDDERRAVRSKLWAEFIKELIKVPIKKEKKAAELNIMLGCIFYHKLGNKFKALNEMSKAQSSKPDLSIEFAVYRLGKIIEFDLTNEDEKLTEERGVDYNSLVRFSDGYAVFQKQIMKACKYHRKFYEEIEEKAPDIFRIYKYGHRLMKEKEEIAQMFEELCKISPNHQKNLKLYSRFLEVVLNDSETAFTLQEKWARPNPGPSR